MSKVPPSLTHEAQVAVEAATAAGRAIARAFHQPKNVQHKGKVDLVTETDRHCERLVLDILRSSFPEHRLIGEEETAANGGLVVDLTEQPTWMVDPLDGTTNFVHRWPFCCVSVALVVAKELSVGVVYNPVLEELFVAEAGRGAYLNGERIQASTTENLGEALVATEVGVSRDEETLGLTFERLRKIAAASRSVRCNGSCALGLCSVACGRLDVFYEIGFGGCWDVAAGALILREAGGEVLDPSGVQFGVMSRRVLGANAHLGKAAAAILESCGCGEKEPQPPA